jgi:uncharacterized protein
MRSLRLCVLALVIAGTPAFAADTRPSETSIRQLLAVTEARKLLDGMMMQLDGMMQNSMQQALKGQTITPGQQKILDGMQTKIVALLKQEMKWENLEAVYLRVYRDSFTQEEVDGRCCGFRAAQRRPIDADGNAMMLQPVEQCVDQTLLLEDFVPLGQVQIRSDDC